MSLVVGPTGEIAACAALRRAVFIDEQGVPEEVEQDGRDGAAHHILATLDGRPGGLRAHPGGRRDGPDRAGLRAAAHRGQGIGTALVMRACLTICAACPASPGPSWARRPMRWGFTNGLGFVAFGPEFADAGGQPHRMMGRAL